jgi:hypothetical protein
MTVGTFDSAWHLVQAKTANLATARTAVGPANTSPAEMWSNSNALNSAGTGGTYNNDTNTSYTNMWNGLENTVLQYPLPGDGQRIPGHVPQGVIFIVTDGVRDEAIGNNVNNRWIDQMQTSSITPDWCALAKSYNFRIAILYTSYFPLPTNSFYNANVAPFQSVISQNLSNCASAGLFKEVSTDGDISGALSSLFQAAVATAHIIQ